MTSQMRSGTDVDRDALGRVLQGLDFDVTIYNDLKKSELFAILDRRESGGKVVVFFFSLFFFFLVVVSASVS